MSKTMISRLMQAALAHIFRKLISIINCLLCNMELVKNWFEDLIMDCKNSYVK